jgi:gallate decarboxylase subunit D
MKTVALSEGTNRTRVHLMTRPTGNDLVVFITNDQAHVGAVAVAEYSVGDDRASTSVITRHGHKDDLIAYMAAHILCRRTKRPVCAIAGIHLDTITKEEIDRITQNCGMLVERLGEILDEQSRAAGEDPPASE